MSQGYKDLQVWQKSVELVGAIYEITAQFPPEEQYGLASQMKRSAVSIPANIAEGSKRGSKKDFRHFLIIAFGSGAELETHIVLAKTLPFGKNLDYTRAETFLSEVMKTLNTVVRAQHFN